MPLFLLQLKTIYQSMTSFLTRSHSVKSIFLSAVLILLSSQSLAFNWPFNTDEFQKKLSAKDLAPATRYFARGPSFLSGQKWDETQFSEQLKSQRYRIRESEQVLMAGDAQKLQLPHCKYLTQIPDMNAGFTCWAWQTHSKETYLVVISDAQIVHSTWQLMASEARQHWKASLDPILIAQYKGSQPIMQMDLKISDIPVNCLNAVMAIEDSEFLQHSGVSYVGLTRSLIKNISKMRYAQGGSTITQQLVKNYFLTPEKTISRKLKELYLAVKLESEWTKDQILETYLNIIYMGQSGAFQVLGFGAASQYYFNKPVQQLNLSECALMAAIVNNPGVYNPWKKDERSTARRSLVLDKMLELNLISEQEKTDSKQASLPKRVPPVASETAPYFLEAARQQLKELGEDLIPYNVYTSLDLDAQQVAQTSLQSNIERLETSRKQLIKNKEKGLKLEGLVIAAENQTGLVTVLVGGQNYRQTQFNRALNGKRQIGSLIKPFVYLLALNNGATPLTEIADEKFTWTYDKKNWSPQNYDRKFHGTVPMYHALKESLNIPAAKKAQEYGVQKLIDLARNSGFTSPMEPTPATSLGASTHYPIEVLNAYRSLANMGQVSKSSYLEKVTDYEGHPLYEYAPKFESLLDAKAVAVLVGMMKETMRSGTAEASMKLGWTFPSAGKTGTTSDNKDAWFTAFTPYQTEVVWLGYDQGISSSLTGGGAAVPIWIETMKKARSRWPDVDFKWPEGVEYREVPLFPKGNSTQLIFVQ